MLRILHSKSVRCGNVRLFTSKLNLDINMDSNMFNRVREVNRMTQLLSSSPGFYWASQQWQEQACRICN